MFNPDEASTYDVFLHIAIDCIRESNEYRTRISNATHKINNISEMIDIKLSLISKELDKVSIWNPWKFKQLLREFDLLQAWAKFLFDLQDTYGENKVTFSQDYYFQPITGI